MNKKDLVLSFLKRGDYTPLKPQELSYILQVPNKDSKEFYEVLSALESDGKIIITKKNKIILSDELNLKVGIFTGSGRGYGFVTTDDGIEVFIPSNRVNGAFHKDKVQIKITAGAEDSRKAEGEVVKILSKNENHVIGIYESVKSFGFVLPRDSRFSQDIFIKKSNSLNAVNGQVVAVKITKSGDGKDVNPEGKIVEIIGHINDPGMDILSIVRSLDISTKFSNKVISEVSELNFTITEDELQRRTDYKSLTTVTIDGYDSKDLDDAISISFDNDIYTLGVHIADVSHYVREGSSLDAEALNRGTSVYLLDRVIPMLPHELSSGICSLNVGEDRLSLSCTMQIDTKGNVISHKIEETVINVDKRMVYDEVNQVLDGEQLTEYDNYKSMIDLMYQLSLILKSKRINRGGIEFGISEPKIILDEDGGVAEIKIRHRGKAERIIEDFMILANETVAEHYHWLEIPFIYRTHEEPDESRIKTLSEFVYKLGYKMKGKKTHVKTIQNLINQVADSEESSIVNRLTLRSLKQAKYKPDSEGHFGLASKYYCHFTSPIRRYPDLMIHRIIKKQLNNQEIFIENLTDICNKSSILERRAEEAEEKVENMKKVEFMSDKIGWKFTGIVSNITNFGVYVELPNTVYGMVALSDMTDDYYTHDSENYRLVGERTGRIYSLGQKVVVRLVGTDIFNMQVDFILE